MWRAVILTLGLMLSFGVVVPLLANNTEAGARQQHRKHRKHRKHRELKKHSKAWWRAYHRRQRRHRALAARKRALRLRQASLAKQSFAPNGKLSRRAVVRDAAPAAVLPFGANAPAGWKSAHNSKSALQFRVDDDGGNQLGAAAISVVGPATGADSDTIRNRAVGGVSTSALRRTVIDRMMKEDGWVVNDYQKEIGGKTVYVVVAQSKSANNQLQSRLFYFTEVEGKIYSIAASAPTESSERLARESEKVVNSLQHSNSTTQAAALR